MLRTLSLLLLVVTFGYSQWRDSSRVLVPAPSGKAVKATQFAIGDTNTWKVSGAIAYMGGNFYIANGTYYVLMAGSGSSSADTATFVTKNTTQVIGGTKYYTAPQYFRKTLHAGIDSFYLRGDTSSVVTIGYVTGTGTVAIASGDTIVYGSGTSFLSTFIVGQTIFITDPSAPEEYTISSIQSDTQLGISTPHLGDGGSGFEYQYIDTVTSLHYPAYFKYYNGTLISVGDTSFMPVRDKTKNAFLWFPSRGALRSGYASGAQWDSSSLGLYSASFGYNNTVSNSYSFSSGASNTVSGAYSSAFGRSNTVAGGYSILGGLNLSSASVPYVNLFGANLHMARQTLGGFGYANSADTVYFGHATVSLGVPFVAANFAKPLSGGEELGAFAMFADGIADSSAFRFQQYAGVAGTGGLTTSSLMLIKTKNTSDINYGKWDGSKQYQFMYIDTSNNMYLNYAKTADWSNQGDVYVNMGNFTVTAGSVDADSMRDDGTTWRTSVAYHSGLGASSMGNLSTGTINSNSNTITVGSVTSNGTISTTGTGAHTFATAGSGFTVYRDGGAASSHMNTYGNTNGSFYYSNTFAGTRAAPSQIGASQVLGNFMGSGYINGASRDMAKMQYLAKSTPSATNYSSYGRFQFVPDSSTTLTTHTILDWTNLTTPRLTLGTTAGTGRGNLYIDSLYFGTTLAIDANRKHTNVGGIATTGAFGVAPIADTVLYSGVSSSLSSRNLPSTAGTYRISYTLATTTAGSGGTVVMTLAYNNGAAQTTTRSILCNTASLSAGGVDDGVIVYRVTSGTPTIATTYTGTGGAVYYIDATVERLK